MNTYALDFESYYDKHCSIRVLGPVGYFSHPDFDPYLVSVVGDDGYEFVGDPKEFDWSILKDNIVLSHNASFDQGLYLFGVKAKWWPSVDYKEWHCTADMSVYCGHPRSLKKATEEVLKISLSKETRDAMKGIEWSKMDEKFKQEVLDYATKDSEYCLQLWQHLSESWPEREREISRMNRESSQKGLPIDVELLREQKEKINLLLFETENTIPWIDKAPILSRKAFNAECRKAGVEPPKSLALTNKEANEWIKKNGKEYVWIQSVRNYRRVNSVKRKIESFENATYSDLRFYGNIMYFGASVTGRFSGAGGNLNLQNLPRGEMFGCNLRHLIKAEEGKKIIVADLSQIEVRTLCWLAEDKKSLERIKKSKDIYEAFAVQFGLWEEDSKEALKDVDPVLRHKVKAMVLGCGYGVGYKKFSDVSGLSLEDSEEAVNLYREKMSSIVNYWNTLNKSMRSSERATQEFAIKLPSGRNLNYGVITQIQKEKFYEYYGLVVRNSARRLMKLYGGLLAENASQALARDIFCDSMLRMEKEGIKIICHVHDEVVIECDEADSEETLDKVISIMNTPPSWIPDIPLDSEGQILERYDK